MVAHLRGSSESSFTSAMRAETIETAQIRSKMDLFADNRRGRV